MTLNKYKKNILKQYGKHIKAHEERFDHQTLVNLQVPHFQKRGGRWFTDHTSLMEDFKNVK